MVRCELFTNVPCFFGKVVPIGDYESIRSIPQLPCNYDYRLEQLTAVANEASEDNYALTKVEESIKETKFDVDSRHPVHDQRPDGQRKADEHRAQKENQEHGVLKHLISIHVIIILDWL